MSKIGWVAIVLGAWAASSGFTYFAFGWPIEWTDLPPAITVCAIAYFTFPNTPRRRAL